MSLFFYQDINEPGSLHFGVHVSNLTSKATPVPKVLEMLLMHVEMNGLYSEGIYRKSGSTCRARELHQILETSKSPLRIADILKMHQKVCQEHNVVFWVTCFFGACCNNWLLLHCFITEYPWYYFFCNFVKFTTKKYFSHDSRPSAPGYVGWLFNYIFPTGPEASCLDNYPIHTITGLVKRWLRELPDPLMTYDLYKDFLHAVGTFVLSNFPTAGGILFSLEKCSLLALNLFSEQLHCRGQGKMSSHSAYMWMKVSFCCSSPVGSYHRMS